jgi:phage repressor protein C with HTH and peptisase S24 domain
MGTTRGERLRTARARVFRSGRQAAEALDISPATYSSHERAEQPGGRDFGPEEAKRYAKRFQVSAEWLLMGTGEAPALDHVDSQHVGTHALEDAAPFQVTVKVKGYVGAGAQAHFYAISQGDLDEVPAPEGSTPDTVAVEIRGDSLGSMLDRWLVFYDDVRRPATADLNGRLCVVGLADDRVLIKKLRRQPNGLWRLLSEREEPIENAEIEWAAAVKNMVPQ